MSSTKRSTLVTSAFSVLFVSLAQVAKAESNGRVHPKLTSNWQAPTVEDLESYLQVLPAMHEEAADDNAAASPKTVIKNINKVLTTGVDKQTRHRLLERLAAAHFAAAAEQRRAEIATYKQLLVTFLAGDASGKEPVADHTKSRNQLLKALDTYRNLLSAAPAYNSRADIALNMGRILALLGSPNAVPDLNKVATEFVKSPVADRARLVLAELQIRSGKGTSEAESILTALAKTKDRHIKAYAKYRLAWLGMGSENHAKQAEFGFAASDSGSESLTTLREIATRECRASAPANQLLCQQASDDLVYLFANSQQLPTAETYFKARRDSERYFLTLERSAWMYIKGDKSREAALVLAKLIHDAPTRAATPQIYLQLAKAQTLAEDHAGAATTMENMSRDCVRNTGVWVKAHAADKATIADAKQLFGTAAATMAVKFAQQHKEKGLADLLTGSNRIFASYLAAFPSGEESDKLRFHYAEGLKLDDKPGEAAGQYLVVASNADYDPAFRNRAADRMLELQLQVSGPAMELTPQTWATLKAPQPLSKMEQQLTAVVDTYAKIYPERKQVPELRLRAAALQLSHGNAENTRTRVETLVSATPTSKATAAGIIMLLIYHNERHEWDTTMKLSGGFTGSEQIKDQQLRARVRDAWRFAMWNKASDQNEAKDLSGAAKTFTLFAETFPTDKAADQALANASAAWLKLGNGQEGVKPCLNLISIYPRSNLRISCLKSIASVYEQKLEYSAAADAYAQLASAPGCSSELAAESILKSADLYADDRDMEGATQKLRKLIRDYPKSVHAPIALLKLAAAEKARDQTDAAIAAYDKYFKLYANVHLEDAMLATATAAMLAAQKNEHDARRRLERAETLVAAAPTGVGFEARALLASHRFTSVHSGHERVGANGVSEFDLAGFSKSLKELRGELKNAETAYQAVTRLGDAEYETAAHYQLALLYEQAFNIIKVLPHASTMTGGDMMNAVNLREAAILEFKSSMNSHLELGLKVAQTAHRHDRWLRLTRAKLAQISPKRYNDSGEIMLKPMFTSHLVNEDMTETN